MAPSSSNGDRQGGDREDGLYEDVLTESDLPMVMVQTRERLARVEENQETIHDAIDRVDENIEQVADALDRIDDGTVDQEQFREDTLPKIRAAHRMTVILRWGGPVALALMTALIGADALGVIQ